MEKGKLVMLVVFKLVEKLLNGLPLLSYDRPAFS